ncbi:MAG: hypothetical protein JW765_05965 [Deltaproteobacteria bacterium]|nr:hypothetical protein [Candidatus Zymogenaceae bacterium]
MPILNSKIPTTAEFKADMDTTYLIAIQFDNSIDKDYWEYVFGCSSMGICKHNDQYIEHISVLWKITSESKIIDEGVATGPGRWAALSNKYTSSRVARFPAENKKSYKIQIVLSGPTEKISTIKPHLIVEAPPWRYKDAYIIRYICLFISVVIVILSLIIFCIEILLRRRIRKNKEE